MQQIRPLYMSIGAALCALTLVACSDKPEAKYPTGAGGAGAAQASGGTTPTPQTGAGGQNTPVATSTGVGGAAPSTTGGAGAAGPTPSSSSGGPASYATPIPPLLSANAGPMLRGLAQSEVAGMRSDGSGMAAQFQPGQIYEQTIQLQPGRCYAVVGVGLGITELDIELIIHQPPAPEYVASRDQSTGPQAVLGGRKNCFKNPLPFPAPAKVRIRATSGAGVGMAQVFSR